MIALFLYCITSPMRKNSLKFGFATVNDVKSTFTVKKATVLL